MSNLPSQANRNHTYWQEKGEEELRKIKRKCIALQRYRDICETMGDMSYVSWCAAAEKTEADIETTYGRKVCSNI